MGETLSVSKPGARVRGGNLWAVVPVGVSVLFFILLLLSAMLPFPARTVQAAGTLQVEIVAAYNLVVDSNVASPSTYAPRVATVIGKFCNTGDAPLTGVYGFIGDGTTPGIYPSRDSASDPEFQSGQKWNYLYNTGLYAFRHLGPRGDATRYMGTIPAGACRYQYWSFEYPACENLGGTWQEPPCAAGTDPLWGDSIKPDDDFSLQFVIWGTSDQGNANATWTMTIRNEISAMANKIKPNPDGQWFNTKSDTIGVGQVITSNGILYEFGNIRQGFDNDGDYVPDYNAWAQPISQVDYDPTCFRLIRTTGVLTITRSGGNPTIILPFEESLYFTHLPPDNTDVRGEIHYIFLALKGPCSMALTPYQEVASGFDNEKFNGDYGTGIPGVRILEPTVLITKSSAPDRIFVGETTTYTIPFANTGSGPAGLTLASGFGVEMPLVISDTVPDGMQLAAAATYYLNFSPNSGMTVRYSTNSGLTWSETAPVGQTSTWPNNKIIIQWWMKDPLPAGSTGNYVRYRATVPSGYSGSPFIENTACIGLGDASPFACDTALTIVQGTGTIGDYVWRDENSNAQQDDGATGINGVSVSLYWDRNGDGQQDEDDVLLSTQNTYTYGGNPGYYQFTQLPAGNYLVVVDRNDGDIPFGYRPTTPVLYAVALASGGSYQAADFGFGPSLTMEKRMLPFSPDCGGYEGREVVYSISLTNERPGSGETVPDGCRYPLWATTGSTANPPKNFTDPAYAFGKPDGLYASGDFAIGANRWIRGTGFDPGSAGGTITQVEAVFRLYLSASLSDDYATARLYQGTTELAYNNFTTAQLNNFAGQGNVGYLTWAIPASSAPGGSWDWGDFALLTLHLEPQKSGQADVSMINLDAIGFRVTTSSACPTSDPNDIMTTVPLTDTYDTTYLQFLSAIPPHTAVDTVNGLITWTNVGPIYPGETRVVYVRFLALNIGASSVVVNNSAGSTGTRFADGGYANNVHDTASGTICPTGSINGYVFSDRDTQGWPYAPGTDLPIPGVRVTLYGCYDRTTGGLVSIPAPFPNQSCTASQNNGEWRAVSTQVTDASGYYAFNGLLNGFYYVQVASGDIPGTVSQTAEANDNQSASGTLPDTTANGHTCGQPGGTCDDIWGNPAADLNTTNFNPINSPGETINGVNFGYNIQAGAYGLVWEDNNGDGDRDAGEGPIGSVTVRLYTGSCGGTLVASTTTDASGRYQFGNLTPGTTYYIAVDTSTLPGGASAWVQTGESDGSINNCISFTAEAGALSGSHDFGFRRTGSYTIGDTLYYDWDGDGTQDGNEEGIPHVTVYLYEDGDGDGVIDPEDAFITSTTTSGTGFYQFTGLPAGSYLVIVATDDPDFPASVVQTQDPDESGVCIVCDSRGGATLGPSDMTVDFGYRPRGTGTIGDTVWRDMNGDGVQAGPTETGIAGITVWLEVDLNGDGTYSRVMTTTTDADGHYLFSSLPDGRYRVVVDATDADLPVGAYGYPYTPSTPTTTGQITISGGSTYLEADFGFMPLGAIGDTVWQDTNGNGNQDIGEPGIAGVRVWLYEWFDSNGNGYYDSGDGLSAAPLMTDTTDADGLYLFSGLPAGNYVVRVDTSTIPSGFTQTGDPDWTSVCVGEQCDSASGVNLRVGQVNMSRDFGYRPQGVIGDYIWFDGDGDGVQDPDEQGIGYVTVRLCADAGCGTVLGTTQTDSDGYYAFGNLDPGTYYVQVVSGTLPAGLTPTYDKDGVGTPHIAAVTLPAGGSDLTVDFGYRYVGNYDISGHVFFDAGNDGGLYNPGTDTPYEGITVYLWRDGVIIGITTTNASGYYVFPDLPNGDYVVSVDRDSPQLAGLTQNTPAPNPPYHRSVTINNASVPDQDFGYYAAVDYGDLPDTYRTLVASEGPGHIVGGPRLGGTITTEPNGQPSNDASGDQGDDGIAFRNGQFWTPGATVNITATVSGDNGYLVGWFDWNNDGSFSVSEMVIFGDMVNGVNPLTLEVPQGASTTGYFYMRFRVYDSTTLTTISYSGLARGGEVEDYLHRWQPTAVRLLSFVAAAQPSGILLTWETAGELNNLGFNLYRRPVGTQILIRLNEYPIPSVPEQGGKATYTFLDAQVVAGMTYEYFLEDVDLNGTRTQYGPVVARALYAIFFPLLVP